MTPKEIGLVLDGYKEKKSADFEAQRVLNYELANLITFAQHDPKKMPEYKRHDTPKVAADSEVQQAKSRGAFIAWAKANGG